MITAVFPSGRDVTDAQGLTQWDRKQILRIKGLHLPAAVEVHFSLSEYDGEAIPVVGVTEYGITDVEIPAFVLENEEATKSYTAYAFIYLENGEHGETVKKIKMPVNARPKPIDYVSPEDIALFKEAIRVFNEAVKRAEQSGIDAKRWAVGVEEIPGSMTDNSKHYSLESKKASNTAVENATIAVNNAENTELDKTYTEQLKQATDVNLKATEENLKQSELILQQQIAMLGKVPMIYAVLTLEELQAVPNAKEGDFGIVQQPTMMLFRYEVTGANGEPLSAPSWVWMTDLNISFNRESLLDILNLAAVATTGRYSDLHGIPKRYNQPVVLDGTGEIIVWDYSQSDTAVVTLTENKPIDIINAYNGCVAVLHCYGGMLDFSDTTKYNTSVTFNYIDPLEDEHITYTLLRNATKWDVTALPYKGAEADV